MDRLDTETKRRSLRKSQVSHSSLLLNDAKYSPSTSPPLLIVPSVSMYGSADVSDGEKENSSKSRRWQQHDGNNDQEPPKDFLLAATYILICVASLVAGILSLTSQE